MNVDNPKQAGLRREVGFTLFLLYGVGNIVGAGIYVLIGKVAAEAGYAAPFAFVLAAVVAGLTGLSYGELAARYPHSAGEAVYIYKAFQSRWLSTAVGLLIAIAGLVSAATIARGFVGYFNLFIDAPGWLVIVVMLSMLTLVAARGIIESAWVNALFTIFQVGGLIWLIMAAGTSSENVQLPPVTEFLPTSNLAWAGVFGGTFLAFYAFIGFEDMVNLAEEVREPAVTIPRAIMLAFALSTVLYVLLAFVSISLVAPAVLAGSDAPLTDVCAAASHCSQVFISLIRLTVITGALVQIIMASRIFYGMSRSGWLPKFLSAVHAGRQTPLPAIFIAGGLALLLALTLPILSLAKLTSGLVLTVFVLVNLALVVIKRQGPAPAEVRPVPLAVPVAGLLCSALILLVAI
jgi:APA family basic amino acid/polyamine antiporter